jgi:ABC-type branched-subunit amino acid transport system ATPase component
MAAIFVEQNPRAILPVVQQVAILERGRLVYSGSAMELMAEPGLIDRHLAVAN